MTKPEELQVTKFDPDSYHVRQDLGDDWYDAKELEHIQGRVRLHAVPLSVLIEDPSNVRLHPENNLEGIRGSYAKYKQRVLLVVNVRTMIVEKGNGSLRSLREGGFSFAAVLFVNDDPATATGFAIADNRTSEQAVWDLPALFSQLSTLAEADYEVPGIEPEFLNELKVLVDGADFAPLPDVSDEDGETRTENGSIKIKLKPDCVIEASKLIREYLATFPEWEAEIQQAG